jgi:transcriptional regulator with XRE-family HTH domain/phage-related protein
MPST